MKEKNQQHLKKTINSYKMLGPEAGRLFTAFLE